MLLLFQVPGFLLRDFSSVLGVYIGVMTLQHAFVALGQWMNATKVVFQTDEFVVNRFATLFTKESKREPPFSNEAHHM